MWKSLISLVVILVFSPFLMADVHTAAGCSCAQIQAAIDAASEGDIVRVPALPCTWSGVGCITINKGVSIIGAGIGNTVITDDTTSASDVSTAPIILSYTSNTNTFARISGFTFLENQPSRYSSWGLIAGGISGTGTDKIVRVDHIKFDGTKRRCFRTSHDKLLMDHIEINECDSIFHRRASYNDAWLETPVYGNNDYVFIEDSTFTISAGDHNTIDCEYGGRVVARYNTFTTTGTATGQQLFNHGYDSVYRGCMWLEAYYNTIQNTRPSGSAWTGIWWRGGTGVAHHNTITGSWTSPIRIQNYRSCSDYDHSPSLCVGGANNGLGCSGASGCPGGTCTPVGPCALGSLVDGGGTNGYPCRDQIGRAGPSQTLMPVYQWDNTYQGNPVNFSVGKWSSPCTNQDDHIIENRDYYNGTSPDGYTTYTYPHPAQSYNCDINSDGSVNSTDVSFLLDVILGAESSTKGDLNFDNAKDILDLMKLISVVLGRTTCP